MNPEVPVEILQLIYSFLDIKSLPSSVQLHYKIVFLSVSKLWRLALFPKVFEALDISHLQPSKQFSFFALQAPFEFSGFELRLVTLRPDSGSNSKCLGLVRSAIWKLKILHLRNVDLRSLQNGQALLGSSELVTRRSFKLSELSLDNCRFDVPLVLNLATNLTTLKLDNCGLDDEFMRRIYAPNLEIISVAGNNIQSLKFLAKLPLVTNLDVSFNDGVDIDCLGMLTKSVPLLKILSIAGLRFYSRQVLGLAQILESKPLLVAIDGRDCPAFQPALLEMPDAPLRRLLKIGIGYNAFLTETSARALFPKLESLNTLVFAQTTVLTDLVLHQTCSRLSGLTKLSLPNQPRDRSMSLVSPNALLKIPTALPYLTYFQADGYLISSDTLLGFANYCKHLHILDVSGCQSIIPHCKLADLKVLCEGCPDLVLVKCRGLLSDSLKLRAEFKKLQFSHWRTKLEY